MAFHTAGVQAQRTNYPKLAPAADKRVRELAAKLLTDSKSDWGEPASVERVSKRTVWVRYKTTKREEQRYWYRIVAIDTEKWKAAIVRNE